MAKTPLFIDTYVASFESYIKSLSHDGQRSYGYVKEHNADISYMEIAYNRDLVESFMELWEKQLVYGRPIKWEFAIGHVDNLCSQKVLRCFAGYSGSEVVSLHFVEDHRGYVYCHPPMYDKVLHEKRRLGTWMWFSLIKFAIENKIGYVDMGVGGGSSVNWRELIRNRDIQSPSYKWAYIPKHIKKNPDLQPRYLVEVKNNHRYMYEDMADTRPHAIAVVAHHDDHAIWMGGTIQRLIAAGWKLTVVALCIPNKERRDYFYHCCSIFGAKPIAFEFQDYMRDEPFSRNSRTEMQKRLEEVINNQHFDFVFTHSRNTNGEYGKRHANHCEVRDITIDLVDKGRLGRGRAALAFFCYGVAYGKGSSACADLDANHLLPLTYRELLWKCQLCSLTPDVNSNLKALDFPCPNPEAFEGDGLVLPDLFIKAFPPVGNNVAP